MCSNISFVRIVKSKLEFLVFLYNIGQNGVKTKNLMNLFFGYVKKSSYVFDLLKNKFQ